MVEADAIKNRDVVYQQLSHALPSSANVAAEVHCQSSQRRSAVKSLCVKGVHALWSRVVSGMVPSIQG